MSFYNPICNGKTEAKACGLSARPGLFGTIEPLEDVRQVFGWDAGPGVPADDAGLFPDPLKAQKNFPALRRVLNCVRNQVDKDLFEPVTIAIHIHLIDFV